MMESHYSHGHSHGEGNHGHSHGNHGHSHGNHGHGNGNNSFRKNPFDRGTMNNILDFFTFAIDWKKQFDDGDTLI